MSFPSASVTATAMGMVSRMVLRRMPFRFGSGGKLLDPLTVVHPLGYVGDETHYGRPLRRATFVVATWNGNWDPSFRSPMNSFSAASGSPSSRRRFPSIALGRSCGANRSKIERPMSSSRRIIAEHLQMSRVGVNEPSIMGQPDGHRGLLDERAETLSLSLSASSAFFRSVISMWIHSRPYCFSPMRMGMRSLRKVRSLRMATSSPITGWPQVEHFFDTGHRSLGINVGWPGSFRSFRSMADWTDQREILSIRICHRTPG